jgi:TonB family protein
MDKSEKIFNLNYSMYVSIFFHLMLFLYMYFFLMSKKQIVYVDVPIQILQVSENETPASKEESISKKEIKPNVVKQKINKVVNKPIKQETIKQQTKDFVTEQGAKVKENVEQVEKPVQTTDVTPVKPTRGRVQTITGSKPTFVPNVKVENFEYPYYLKIIQTKVSSAWQYPDGLSGNFDTVIYFKIDKSGNIISCELSKSSGNNIFDNACLRAVRLSGPYPELPQDYKEDFLGVYFGFQFKV